MYWRLYDNEGMSKEDTVGPDGQHSEIILAFCLCPLIKCLGLEPHLNEDHFKKF